MTNEEIIKLVAYEMCKGCNVPYGTGNCENCKYYEVVERVKEKFEPFEVEE